MITIKEKLLFLVSKSKIKQVLEELNKIAHQVKDEDLKKDIILISSSYEQLEGLIRKGIYNNQEANIETNKIAYRLVGVINELEINTNNEHQSTKKSIFKNKILILGITLSLLLLVALFLNKSEDKNTIKTDIIEDTKTDNLELYADNFTDFHFGRGLSVKVPTQWDVCPNPDFAGMGRCVIHPTKEGISILASTGYNHYIDDSDIKDLDDFTIIERIMQEKIASDSTFYRERNEKVELKFVTIFEKKNPCVSHFGKTLYKISNLQEKKEYISLEVFTRVDAIYYHVTCTCPYQYYNQIEKVFQKIISSIEINCKEAIF